MHPAVDLSKYGIRNDNIIRNAAPALLYEHAVKDFNAAIVDSGALAIRSGPKTGRSPRDKRIVEHPHSSPSIGWGDVNIPLSEQSFYLNRQQARDYFSMQDRVYVQDGFAGWQSRYRYKFRVICDNPYHALFIQNMLIRPNADELLEFGEPDYVIYNAGRCPANRFTPGLTSDTSIALNFEQRELVILGTAYAGEMKKGVFTIMNHVLPERGVLSMHCSANAGANGQTTLFFGLSGTGKTTLSADPRRRLIGDDEHAWSDEGIFNIEGGCYAKVIHLSQVKEPEIFAAIRFGTVLENVTYDPHTRAVDYRDTRITENTRAAYPIEYIPNAEIPCVGPHPEHIILLTCDAFGVLPPVSRLTIPQAIYHFLSGYTAKVAGTEVGVAEPQATFSACYGAAFLVAPPTRYADLLAQRLERHRSQVWLVNTGWTGGPYGVGERLSLPYTRAIIDAIHEGSLAHVPTAEHSIFQFAVPQVCPGVPNDLLMPENTWPDKGAYDATARRLAALFQRNFATFAPHVEEAVRCAGPRIEQPALR